MKRGFVTFLPDGEYERRFKALCDLGISQHAIQKLRKQSPQLCAKETAMRRIDHLRNIGFTDPFSLIESQPLILVRSEETINAHLEVWKKGYDRIGLDVSIHDLCISRPQIFSAMVEKVQVIFLLAEILRQDLTVVSLCNAVTINVEKILLAYAQNRNCYRFRYISNRARKITSVPTRAQWTFKACMIKSIRTQLPDKLYAAYIDLIIAANPKIDAHMIRCFLCA